MVIKRNSKGEYVLISLKTGRVLGRFKERKAAENRERQIKHFKRINRQKRTVM
jgi:hypothetical protein